MNQEIIKASTSLPNRTTDGKPRSTIGLPTERNARRYAVLEISVATAMAATLIGGLLLAVPFAGDISDVLVGTCLMLASAPVLLYMCAYTRNPTPYLGDDQRHSLEHLIKELAGICHSGMEASECTRVQNKIDLFTQTIRTIFGKDPGLVAEDAYGVEEEIVPTSVREMGRRICRFDDVARDLTRPHGIGQAYLRRKCVNLVPLIAAIAREFGLDAKAYDPPVIDLPGLRSLPSNVHENRSDVPMSPARALAERWMASDRNQVDELLRIAADTAAGRDLRQLEKTWVAARNAAPERHAEIDAKYDAAVKMLASTLTEALNACGQAAINALDTQGRYISVKSMDNSMIEANAETGA